MKITVKKSIGEHTIEVTVDDVMESSVQEILQKCLTI
jgi:hypothetical protein